MLPIVRHALGAGVRVPSAGPAKAGRARVQRRAAAAAALLGCRAQPRVWVGRPGHLRQRRHGLRWVAGRAAGTPCHRFPNSASSRCLGVYVGHSDALVCLVVRRLRMLIALCVLCAQRVHNSCKVVCTPRQAWQCLQSQAPFDRECEDSLDVHHAFVMCARPLRARPRCLAMRPCTCSGTIPAAAALCSPWRCRRRTAPATSTLGAKCASTLQSRLRARLRETHSCGFLAAGAWLGAKQNATRAFEAASGFEGWG